MSNQTIPDFPLYILCVEHENSNPYAIAFACEQAKQNGGRIGLFSTLDLDEFQNWATVEDTMKQELREKKEKNLWTVAGVIKDQYGMVPEFYIGEGKPLEALAKIIEKDQTVKLITVSLSKRDIEYYMDYKAMRKFAPPLVFVPNTSI